MIEDLRIIAKDGGRLSADDCRMIGVAADALEEAWRNLARSHLEQSGLIQQMDALKVRLAEATRPKPIPTLAPSHQFDQGSYYALAQRLGGGYIVAGPGEKPW